MKLAGLVLVLSAGGLISVSQQSAALAQAPESRAQELNACTLLAAEQISDEIGLPVENGFRKDLGFQADGSYSSTCVWIIQRDLAVAPNPRAPLGGKSFVILNATQWPAGSGLASGFLQDFRDAAVAGEIPSAPVPKSYGDEALWWGDGLAVRSGDVSFGVSVWMTSSRPNATVVYEEELAPHILQRVAERAAE